MRQSLGSYKIARLCQVTPATVGRWFKQGKLPFFLTGGGQKRVWAEDLVPFLLSLNLPVPPDLGSNGARRALIVDDDPVFRRALKRLLNEEFADLEVHEAGDGFEGGLKVAQLLPAVVFLDLVLPGQDGLKVCRLIRSNASLRSVKIICMSGHSDEDYVQEALASGADEFVAKASGFSRLTATLKEVVA